MQKRVFQKMKRIVTGFLASALVMMSIPMQSTVLAEDTIEKYPYTIFATSYKEGSISINADNFCVNGAIATNGTITTSGNMNVNGTKAEYVGEDMIYIFNKIDSAYFENGDAKEYSKDYEFAETNINIDVPTVVDGETTLTGNINISTALKSMGNLNLNGEVKNTDNSIIMSKYGDIIIDSMNVNLNGLVYAPFGTVDITAQNLNLNNVIIIANCVTIECPSVNVNYDSNVAAFVGNISEGINIPRDEWGYMEDNNENGLPDFFEDIFNWGDLEDTDADHLPDVIEEWMGSDPNSKDTDGDGIDDYYEEFVYLTDLLSEDSDGNGILDGDEDPDGDGLTNLEEYALRTHPLYFDTDGDGLSDFEEVNNYLTNPNEMDTDGDGADDKWEIENGYDAKNYNETFSINAEVEGDNIKASASMDVSGYQVKSLLVETAEDIVLLDDTIPGYIGSPIQFKIDGDFEQAELSFEFDSKLLDEQDFTPAIYYFNEETQLLEEMPTTVEGNIASTITTHFSVYLLLNKTTYEAAWQTIKAPNSLNVDEVNIAFVVDTSGSMGGDGRITTAKKVIENFVEAIQTNSVKTNIALIKFSSSAEIVSDLSNNYKAFLQKLNSLTTDGLTSIYTGIDQALNVLTKNDSETDSYEVIILLTDGYDEPTTTYDRYQKYVERAVDSNINIYTVGVGIIDEQLLIKLADETDGKYFYASNSDMLYEIYEEIETEIIDYTTDSNNDGISDYYTRLLCDGTLCIGTHCNIFKGISYEEFNSNNDYDGDGIINGEELEIRRDEATGRVYVYLHSNPCASDSDSDGINDLYDNDKWNSDIGLLLYQTIDELNDKIIKSLPFEERPEDYQYADKSIEQIRRMKKITLADFLGFETEDYIHTMKTLALLMSSDGMSKVSIGMVNHFLDGTGTDYSNDVLSQKVTNHESTIEYVSITENVINDYIESHNGDISGLAYIDGDNRGEGVMVKYLHDNDIWQPSYDEMSDTIGGLAFCLHSLTGNRVEVTSYSFDGLNYEYTVRYTLYDIYGLDSADIEDHLYMYTATAQGFRSWYILQHCNLYAGKYKPYFTYVVFEETVEGTLQ